MFIGSNFKSSSLCPVKLDFMTNKPTLMTMNSEFMSLPEWGSIKKGHFILTRGNLIISAFLIICMFYPQCIVTNFSSKWSWPIDVPCVCLWLLVNTMIDEKVLQLLFLSCLTEYINVTEEWKAGNFTVLIFFISPNLSVTVIALIESQNCLSPVTYRF